MEERKRGEFSKSVGEIRKEISEINSLSKEKGDIETYSTYTRTCTSFLTLFCC